MAIEFAPSPTSVRVCYRAPAVLTFDGFQETFDVTVTNLSVEGLGCDGPEGLLLGDQMRLRFALANDPNTISVQCEVVWLTPKDTVTAYGMRFVDLDAETLSLLERATAGRMRPAAQKATSTGVTQPLRQTPSSGQTEAAQDAAFTLDGLWGHREVDHEEAAHREILWAGVSRRQGPFWLRAAWASVVGLLFGGGLTLALLATQDAIRHQEGPGRALWGSWAHSRAAPVVEVMDRGTDAATALGRAVPVEGGRALAMAPMAASLAQDVTVLLAADGPIGERELFWLADPIRLVVDLMGLHEAVAAPVVVPNHPLVRRVRVGQHDDRVRFVIEVGEDAAGEVATRLDGSALAITFRTRESLRE